MNEHCLPAQRSRAVRARDELADDAAVLAATAIGPEYSPVDRWAVALLVDPECGGLPANALPTLADYGLTVRNVHRGHRCWHCLATA